MRVVKNIPPRATRKAVLIAGLLLCSFFSQAQNEEEEIVADTALIAPPDEIDYDREEENNKKGFYFYKSADSLSVDQRTIPGDVVKKFKDDDDFWYANQPVKSSKKNQVVAQKDSGKKGTKGKDDPAIHEREMEDGSIPLSRRSWFQTLLWIVIVGAFAAGLVFYLGSSNIGLFRRKNIRAQSDEGDDIITEDIFAINYQKDIDRAAAQENYRLATRLLFLRLLKTMSEKNIIRYKQDKTNLDYLLELHPTKYYNGFFRVTRNYEYSWYGQFPVSEDQYKMIRNDFDQFDKELR